MTWTQKFEIQVGNILEKEIRVGESAWWLFGWLKWLTWQACGCFMNPKATFSQELLVIIAFLQLSTTYKYWKFRRWTIFTNFWKTSHILFIIRQRKFSLKNCSNQVQIKSSIRNQTARMAKRRMGKHCQLILQSSDTESNRNIDGKVEQVGEVPKKPIHYLKMLNEFKGRL